eukprot:116550_1
MDPKYDYSSDFYECKSSGSVSSDDRHRLRRVLVRLGLDDLFEVPDKFSCGREYRDRFLEAIRMERNCELLAKNRLFMYGSQWNQLWDCSNFQKISFRRLFSGFEQLTDPERAQECKERGNKAFSAHHYDEAIAC